MRDDQCCAHCEWWDRPRGDSDLPEKRKCLRWPGDPWLQTYPDNKCWQWCAQSKGWNSQLLPGPMDIKPGPVRVSPREKDQIDAWHRADLEKAVQLALNAGVSTGHADSCTALVDELLRDRRELAQRLVRARGLIRQPLEGLEGSLDLKSWSDWSNRARVWLEGKD